MTRETPDGAISPYERFSYLVVIVSSDNYQGTQWFCAYLSLYPQIAYKGICWFCVRLDLMKTICDIVAVC